MTSEGMTPADISAVIGNRNDGMFGGDNAWFLIILFLFAFCGGWGGNGFGGNQGTANNYTLASDFATIQRQLSDGFGGVEKGLDTIRNGLCDGFYTEAQLVNGLQISQMQNANAIQNAMQSGFCQTNYNASTNTRDIVDSQNANTRAILDKLCQMESNAKDERIADLTAKNADLRLAASQQAQNAYLIDQLGTKCPIPAYLTCNPNAPLNYSVNYGCGCGQ